MGIHRSFKFILVLLAEFRQNFIHGLGAVICELLGEGAKEEPSEHETESRDLWKPHAIGETSGGRVVDGEISSKETIPIAYGH